MSRQPERVKPGKRIAVVTGARSEYGLLRWIIRAIAEHAGLELCLMVTGSHLSSEYGMTVEEIRSDGFEPNEEIEILLASDSGVGVVKSMGLALLGFADAFRRQRPDLVLVLGDRFETFAVAVAAVGSGLPLVHLCGGEVTGGSLDEFWRHAITKLAHVHMTATQEYARRIVQMGEEAWRVHVVGSPGLENIRRLPLLSRRELEHNLGLRLASPLVVATYHPSIVEAERHGKAQLKELLDALRESGCSVVFTYPNCDAGSRGIVKELEEFVRTEKHCSLFINLGSRRYLSLLSHADAMVGNSSSGLIEAPSFALPVVNVGLRQSGRIRARNVIDVPLKKDAILEGIHRALDPSFRASLRGMENPYGDGRTSERVAALLADLKVDRRLLQKKFVDL